MKTPPATSLALAILLAAAPAGAQERAAVPATVFADAFEDNKAEDAGDAKAYWTLRPGKGSLVEADGKVAFTAAGPDFANVHLVGKADAALNFLAAPLTFAIEGIELAGENAPPEKIAFRFTLTADAATEYLSQTAIGFDVRGDGTVRLGYKLATPQKDPAGANVLVQEMLPGPITGVVLTLGPTDYALSVTDGDASKTFTGKYADKGPGLTAQSWGGDAAAIVLLGQRGQVNDPAAKATLKVDAVRVLAADGAAPAGLFPNP